MKVIFGFSGYIGKYRGEDSSEGLVKVRPQRDSNPHPTKML
jgi:hypothetical protein